ncbi:MAG: TolC family protein [Alphaproteobacteria bacterium]|nr:TolC family protein [Alphaproteobacteria bacterium]
MRKIWIGAALLVAATGCTAYAPEGGFGPVAEEARARLGREAVWIKTDAQAAAARARVRELLARPLDADAAVQIALYNNRGLQAAYAELGIAEAGLVQAGRFANPKFGFDRLRRGDDLDIERGLSFNLLGALVMPIAIAIEERRLAHAQLSTAGEVVRLAADVRRAWLMAVAARQTAAALERGLEAAGARAELAKRMAEIGNVSRLVHAREHAFYAETAALSARARVQAEADRERLVRLLGLWGEDRDFALPDRLPDLPAAAQASDDLEARAMAQRLDIRMARAEIEGLAKSMGLNRATRFVNVLEVSYFHNSETRRTHQTGYGIEISVPLFDWGDARIARAEALYMQAVERVAEAAVNARSQVRESYLGYRAALDLARHYRDEIVPLRARIGDELLQRYNGMLIGVFELLADSRDQIQAVIAAVESQRDFFLAEIDLSAAMTVGGAGGGRRALLALGAAPAAGH